MRRIFHASPQHARPHSVGVVERERTQVSGPDTEQFDALACVPAILDRLLSMAAKEHEAPRNFGGGFNPHYLKSWPRPEARDPRRRRAARRLGVPNSSVRLEFHAAVPIRALSV